MAERTSRIFTDWSRLPANLRPMLDPPEGVIPNFENPDSIGWHIVLATAITLPFAIIACSLRFYTRAGIIGSFRIEDYILSFTLTISLVFEACILYSVTLGLGKDLWDIPWSLMLPVLKWFLATELTYFISICGCKIVILIFYLRFLRNQIQKYATIGILVLVALYSVLTVMIMVFACRPISTMWDWNLDQSNCINVDSLYVFNAVLNTLTSASILLLPVPNVWNLRMPNSQIVGLIGTFVFGALITGISIVRIVQLAKFPNNSRNISIGFAGPSLWAAVEVNFALVAASLPALKPFIARYFGKHFTEWTSLNKTFSRGSVYGEPVSLQLSNCSKISAGTANSRPNRKSLMFYKGSSSMVTTTEITASHSDERGLVSQSTDFDYFAGQSSQLSLPEEKPTRVFNSDDLRIMKISNIIVDSKRISQDERERGLE